MEGSESDPLLKVTRVVPEYNVLEMSKMQG